MARGGSTGATDVLGVLVANHRAFLRFLERRLRSREAAEDLLQDAFGKALRRQGDLRDGESAVAWFFRMLRNAATDHERKSRTGARAVAAFAQDLDDPVRAPSIRREICACVSRLAGVLKPEYSEALRRIDVEGVPVKKFAAANGISSGNAAVRVHRAREALRREVVRSCGTCATHGCEDCACD